MPAERAESLVQALDYLVTIACFNAHRTLTFHRLECQCVGADELSLLAIVAGAQWQESNLARATSRCLVRSHAIDGLEGHAQVVADVLSAQGWRLPLRRVRAPEAGLDHTEQPRKHLLH
jgi:hypothetical protein